MNTTDIINNALSKVQELDEAMDKVWKVIGDCGEVPSNTEDSLEFLEDRLKDLGKSVGGDIEELVFRLNEFGEEGSTLAVRLTNQD